MNEGPTVEERVLETQIKRLQAEVASLQVQLQNNQEDMKLDLRGQIEETMLCMYGKRPERRDEVLSRLKEELGKLEDDLKRQAQMNGISLNSCTIKNLKNSSGTPVQHFIVSGQCSDIVFQVEFQLSEDKEGQESVRTISDLKVVMDSDIQNCSSFLTRVEENRDILLFFRTLRNYAQAYDQRSKTFQHFQEKYPSVVSLPGGSRSEVMTLSHPELPGCVLFIHWSVEVSGEGEVAPKINLLTKIPEKALQLFPSESLGGAAEAFHSLLRILGPEAALESVIRAVGLLPPTELSA